MSPVRSHSSYNRRVDRILRRDTVIRDQKPGKFKLVGAAAPNPGRRRDDQLQEQALAAAESEYVVPLAGDAEAPARSGVLVALLFLLCCAVGGAAVVLFGLVGDLPG